MHARPRRPALYRSLIGAVALWLTWSATAALEAAPAGPPATAAAAATREVQEMADALRSDLALSHEVSIDIVEANPLKASVEPVPGAVKTFRLSIERPFLEQLTPDELRAVVAHELGHVWIYTHFPYLQTEQLANQIALRVVTRESLDRVYGKVWADAREAGALPRFTDASAPAGLAAPRPEDE